MLSLVPYGASSDESSSESESLSDNDIKETKEIKPKEKEEEPKNKEKAAIPSFTEVFENIDKPEYLKAHNFESESVIKFFSKNGPIRKRAMTVEESREEQLQREAKEREEAEKKRTEEEIQNEKERQERVRKERSLYDEFYKMKREGREKFKEKLKRQRLKGQSGIGDHFRVWRSDEEMRLRQQYQ